MSNSQENNYSNQNVEKTVEEYTEKIKYIKERGDYETKKDFESRVEREIKSLRENIRSEKDIMRLESKTVNYNLDGDDTERREGWLEITSEGGRTPDLIGKQPHEGPIFSNQEIVDKNASSIDVTLNTEDDEYERYIETSSLTKVRCPNGYCRVYMDLKIAKDLDIANDNIYAEVEMKYDIRNNDHKVMMMINEIRWYTSSGKKLVTLKPNK